MAQICRQVTGTGATCVGWVGLIVATATNDWVRTCDYTVATCIRMDELGSQGLWAECLISPGQYHCKALNQVFSLPAYVQTSRALMICACLLGLPALLLVLMSMPCVQLPNDTVIVKKRRARVGSVFVIIMAVCGIVSTIWFPVGANKEEHLMSFGFSLYAGWVGTGLCLLGGIVIMFWNLTYMPSTSRDNSFYYSRQGGSAMLHDPPANHAKSERV